METIVSRTLSVHKEHEVLLKLEAAGFSDDLAQKVIESRDNDLAKKVVRLIRSGGLEPSTSQQKAREIMGTNMFGIEDAIKHFDVNPSKTQLAALCEIPFSEEVLVASKDTHVLVALFPLSILDVRGEADCRLFYFHEGTWYNKKQAFAKDRGEIGWQLVRKTPVDNSTSKSWGEQQKLLGKDEETPKAQVIVYTIIAHFLSTGERLFESIYVRCSDLGSDGFRINVGRFNVIGLHINHYWDDRRHDNLGLSSARK